MIYLVYGNQYPILKKSVKKLVTKCFNGEIDEFSYVKLNAKETLVQDIVSECEFIPLGSEKKVVLVYNPYFLLTTKEKCSIEANQDYSLFEKFIESLLNDEESICDLIFMVESTSINKKSKIYKLLDSSNNGKIIFEEGLSKESLLINGIAYFNKKGATITQSALNILLERIGDDISSFIQEAEKLVLYTKNIKEEDVRVMVHTPLEQNTFLILDNLINNKIAEAIKIFRDLVVLKEEPIKLINQISSQFRIYPQVSYLLYEKNMDQKEIADELSIHPYRVKLATSVVSKIKYMELLNILDYLHVLDMKIKKSEVDPNIAFELFLLNFNDIKRGNY